MKRPLGIRILTWFAALASTGMFVSIMLAIFDVGPHLMGGERVTRSEWLHVAAPLIAVIGCLTALIAYGFGTGKPWSRHFRDGDFYVDNRLCVGAWRTKRATAHDHVAGSRGRLPVRLCCHVVLLFQAQRCCVFS